MRLFFTFYLLPEMRYLVPFHPKRQPHFFTDVLIIGGGLAGLRAALAVDPRLRVIVLCKAGLKASNSNDAQGGIATVWDKNDNLADHISDTLVAGGELCDPEVVKHVVSRGPEEIRHIIRIGAEFDKNESGEILLGREGGHGCDRILHSAGDATGRELIRATLKEVQQRGNIRIWETTFALDLLTSDGIVRGAVVYWKKATEKELIWAKQTILATGSIGQLYRETTNPEVATGDGIAMAYRAGAVIRDMEFMQFHPTVLYIAGGSRSLITEAIRGEGAYLVDKTGYRFMFDYDQRGELAPRDVVSRSIVEQMKKTNYPNVFLDLRHKDADFIYKRFPGITEICRNFGLDIAKDRIPVRPGAHYSMGGVKVDIDGRTSVPNLWAVGEVSSTGLHGANRLASNSLLEALVYGESCGRLASIAAGEMPDDYRIETIENPPISIPDRSRQMMNALIDIADIRNSLKSLMWRTAGVVRNADGLRDALENIESWSHYVLERQFESPEGWELQNMLTTARLLLVNALKREETRGAHNREDFPEADPELGNVHFELCGR